MTEPTPEHPTRRIVVALDTSEASRAALQAAARLAAARGAELVGVFVEEEDVLSAACFPFSRVLSASSRSWRTVDEATMTRALQTRARRVRAEVARVATQHGVPWSFRTARGALGAALSKESHGAELVALGRTTARRRRAPLGRGARATITTVRTSVLVTGTVAARPQPVVVVYEGDERVLARAAELGALQGAPVRVAALGRDLDAAAELARQAEQWLHQRGAGGEAQPLVASDPAALAETLREEHVALVVVDPSGPMLGATSFDDWLDRLDQPAFVVR